MFQDVSWEVHSGLASWGSLGESAGLDHWGFDRDREKRGMADSNLCSDLGSLHYRLQQYLSRDLSQALPICRAEPVAPSGQGAQLAVLPDMGPKPTGFTDYRNCFMAPLTQGSKFAAPPDL